MVQLPAWNLHDEDERNPVTDQESKMALQKTQAPLRNWAEAAAHFSGELDGQGPRRSSSRSADVLGWPASGSPTAPSKRAGSASLVP